MNYFNGYEILKADTEEWARYHAIYRLSNFNEWMPLSFQGEINRYLKGDSYYWIIKDNKRVGGAFIKPNMLKCVFTIPPFHNGEALTTALTLYVESISHKGSPVIAPDVDLNSIDYYKALGFTLEKVEKLMVCATGEFEVIWEPRYRIMIPTIDHAKAMTKLYYEAYSSNKFQYISSKPYDFQALSVQIYFSHIASMKVPNEWSTLIYDTVTKKFVGACTVGLVNELPYILDFVVHSDFQRKGIASRMIKRTLNLAFKSYPAIRLNIVIGNDAEVFYDKLGFVSLVEKGYMSKHIKSNMIN